MRPDGMKWNGMRHDVMTCHEVRWEESWWDPDRVSAMEVRMERSSELIFRWDGIGWYWLATLVKLYDWSHVIRLQDMYGNFVEPYHKLSWPPILRITSPHRIKLHDVSHCNDASLLTTSQFTSYNCTRTHEHNSPHHEQLWADMQCGMTCSSGKP